MTARFAVWLDKLSGWMMVLLILAAVVALTLLVQVLRFLRKRVRLWLTLTLDSRRKGSHVTLRPRRPLWWLVGTRRDYDFLFEVTGSAESRILAVKLIPTLMQGTEYSIGHFDRWESKLNFLMPLPHGVIRLDFGYRKCLPRPADRVFQRAPVGCMRVYLLHPHPFALTLARRGERRKSNAYRGTDELAVPLRREGVLLLDLHTLRSLGTADERAWAAVLKLIEVP